jgi:K+-sensing histidine kinase KdpD
MDDMSSAGSEPPVSRQDTAADARRWPSRDTLAVVAGVAGPLALTAILIPFRSSFANTDAALALILLVVAVAAVGSRMAGYLAAASAAIWFDFFLTRPYERFSISRATDIETTVLLLVIGIAVTEIAVWGRRQHADASRRSGYLAGINDAARAAAAGDSPPSLINQVSATLIQLLALRSCQFQYGVAGLGKPARLERTGALSVDGQSWDVQANGMPASIELLVESGGRLQGRFLMQADPSARPTAEQLLVAAAFADQVGAALAASHTVSQ